MERYDRDEVLDRTDLPALADQLVGPRHPRTKTWTCPNPNHAQTGRTPPVSIFTDQRRTERWHCFGCGEGGTAIDLVLRVGAARDFRDALEWLARRAHVSAADDVPLPRPRRPPAPPRPAGLDAIARRALDAYATACMAHLHSPDGVEVRRWLTHTRAIPVSVLDAAGVGADPGIWRLPRPNGFPKVSPAAVFPIRDNGEVVFTLSRVLRPRRHRPRWVNTASTVAPNPRLAFFDPSGPPRAGPLIVTEGVLDALSAVSAGHPAAALLGTGVVDDWVARRLVELDRPLLLATDNDTAGRLARDQLSSFLAEKDVDTGMLAIPERYKDLNDWHAACRNRWPDILTASLRLSATATDHQALPPGVA